MPWFDLPLAELETYRTATAEPDGLDDWWADRLVEARNAATPPVLTRYRPSTYGAVEVYDVEFTGAHGDPIRAWYIRPSTGRDTALPIVVSYAGYGGGRGIPAEHLALPAIGIPVLVMDNRSQGAMWTVGATGDPGRTGSGPEYPGVMTRGIETPETYYFTRLLTDAVRAVDVAANLPGVDRERIAVMGMSQGGGLALAAAALAPDRVKVCHADVPFLCDIQRGIGLTEAMPYAEVAKYLARNSRLATAALNTLRYVDCALLARRTTAECLLSVGLMDQTCPPSTVFAAYNEITAPKTIAVHPFGDHSPPPEHTETRLEHLRQRLMNTSATPQKGNRT